MARAFVAGSALLAINSLVQNVFELDKASRQTQKTMGALGYSYQQTKDSVYAMSIATGEAADKTMEIVTNLAGMRVRSQDVSKLTADVINFSRATTMGEEATARLAGSLMTVGKVGTKGTEDVMNSMVQAQSAFGLTGQQMEGISDTIIRSTQMLQQFGKSAGQISQFASGVAKLSSAFESVGVSAETSNKFVGDLLDPDKITENSLLYSKLGISIQDAFAGNVNMDNSIDKFRELGQQMKQMNPAAAAAYAKSLGMSVGDLRAMADIDMTKYNKALANGVDSATAMKQASQQNLSPQEKISMTWNRIASTVMSLVDKFMPFVEAIVNTLEPMIAKATGWFNTVVTNGTVEKFVKGVMGFISKIPEFFSTIGKFLNPAVLVAFGVGLLLVIMKAKKAFSKNIEEGVSEGIHAGFTKSQIVKKSAESAGINAGKALAGGFGNELRAIQGEYLSRISQIGGTAASRGFAQSGAQIAGRNSILAQGGAQSKIANFGANRAQDASNRRAQIAQDAQIRYETEKLKIYQLSKLQEQKQSEIALFEGSNIRNSERLAIEAEERKLAQQLDLSKAWAEQYRIAKEQKDDKYFANLSHKQRKTLLDQTREEDTLSVSRLAAIQKQKDQESNLAKITDSEIKRLNSVQRTYEDELKLAKLKNERELMATRMEDLHKEFVKEQDLQVELAKKIKHIKGGRTDEQVGVEALNPRTFGKAVRDALHSTMESVSAKLEGVGHKFKTAIDHVTKSFVSNVRGAAKNIGKAAGKMALISLPLMLLGMVFGKLSPIIETLMDALSPLLDAVAKALLPLLKAMIHLIIPLVVQLLPPILKILGNLLGAIGRLIQVMSLGNEDIKNFGEGFIKTGDSLIGAGADVAKMDVKGILDKVDGGFDKLNNSLDPKNKPKNPVGSDNSVSGTGGPVVLQATGSGLRQMNMMDQQTAYQKKTAENSTRQTIASERTAADTAFLAQQAREKAAFDKEMAAVQAQIKTGQGFDSSKLRSGETYSNGVLMYNGIPVAKSGSGYTESGHQIQVLRPIDMSVGPR
jgi:TP901 family phage tail tape measure protein